MKTYGDFPEIIREVIKIRVGSKYNHKTKSTANTKGDGFEWEDSPEGFDFWDEILKFEKIEVFFNKYPLSHSLYPCNQRDKCIARVDIAFEGVDIKRGTVLQNGSGHLLHRLCDYNRYMKQFNPNPQQESNPFNIDYSKPDWWKILEEGDEVVVVEKSGGGEDWPRLELGLVISVTQKDIEKIFCGSTTILFNNNEHCANFTYNMVKLHKKKNKQLNNIINTHDVSGVSNPIRQGIGSTGLSISSRKCQITVGSRLVGTTKSVRPSKKSIRSGVFTAFQHIQHH